VAYGDITDELTEMVRYRLAEPTADRWQDADIWRYLTLAQLMLVQALPYGALAPWVSMRSLANLSGSTSEYDLPDDYVKMVAVAYKSIYAHFWPTAELNLLRVDAFVAPTEDYPVYTIAGNQVVFPFTTTGGTYELRYIARPPDMQGSAGARPSDPRLPWHDLMETFAVSMCRAQAEDVAEADRQQAAFADGIQVISVRYKIPDTVEGGPGDVPTPKWNIRL